jgi:hypothetical protein
LKPLSQVFFPSSYLPFNAPSTMYASPAIRSPRPSTSSENPHSILSASNPPRSGSKICPPCSMQTSDVCTRDTWLCSMFWPTTTDTTITTSYVPQFFVPAVLRPHNHPMEERSSTISISPFLLTIHSARTASEKAHQFEFRHLL